MWLFYVCLSENSQIFIRVVIIEKRCLPERDIIGTNRGKHLHSTSTAGNACKIELYSYFINFNLSFLNLEIFISVRGVT